MLFNHNHDHQDKQEAPLSCLRRSPLIAIADTILGLFSLSFWAMSIGRQIVVTGRKIVVTGRQNVVPGNLKRVLKNRSNGLKFLLNVSEGHLILV